MRGRAFLAIAMVGAALLALLTLAGCPSKSKPGTTGSTATTPSSTATSPTTQPSAGGLTVYFLQGERVQPVPRDGSGGAKEALQDLLEGPSSAEKSSGLTTAIPAGTKLLSYTVDNGVAKADFSEEIASGGSTRVLLVTDQVDSTVMANDGSAKSVQILVAGNPEGLQP